MPDDRPQPETLPASRHTVRRRQWRPARIGVNLTTMIDVTFLLLVYFMVATRFKVGEELYRMDLPDRRQARAQLDPFELDEEPLRINVASVERDPVGLGYRLRVEGPYEQPRTFEDLLTFLEQRRITPGQAGGLFQADHPMIVLPASTARWEHAVGAFNAVARARFTNVTFGKTP